MKKSKAKQNNDAVEILRCRLVSEKPEKLAELEQIRADEPWHAKSMNFAPKLGFRSGPLPKWLEPRLQLSAVWKMQTMRDIPSQCSTGSQRRLISGLKFDSCPSGTVLLLVTSWPRRFRFNPWRSRNFFHGRGAPGMISWVHEPLQRRSTVSTHTLEHDPTPWR